MNFILLSETVVHENPFFVVLDRHYKLPDGADHHFFIRKEVDTCCVLAKTIDGKFLVVKEFRVGPNKMMYDLPAGRLDSFGDDPDDHMAKELLQETGYEAAELKKVGEMPASPYSSRIIHCYYATDCKKIAEQDLDEAEFIELVLMNKSELHEILITGKSSCCGPGLLAWAWMEKDDKL